ncbi:polypeptide N-acetylgalactosaminyltransferase 16-like [Bradysia coprophila]|uniref:polypeptide N-acetylgalactosaminyltransferase 16-like n=1 Tax=Bradysia coprophila TaxID=38358 RepID=UPI00187DA00A|nr:polypeptide N-acetylgalactosaminyltransferase 16-like [Bradysia coprophila]XP_037027894.1 polypeptide N-acetylgalactosaminyltransferase 16-like [Bradysia coprophila]
MKSEVRKKKRKCKWAMRIILNRKLMFSTLLIVSVIYLCWILVEMSMISASGRKTGPKRTRTDRTLMLNITHSNDTTEYLAREIGSPEGISHITVNRDVPDTRPESCKTRNYQLVDGQKASVIITFYNESRSALLRTLTSILNRTPLDLIEEIIVIDDHSTTDVEPQFLRNYHKTIKLIRNDQREGLIRSRNIGAKLAVGHYLVFLDSHCEVNVGWLEPLIHQAEEQQGVVVSPILDVIDWQSLLYRSGSNKLRGGFDWSLQYKWIAIPEEELESRSFQESFAYSTPSIPGGVFLISRVWFRQLGGFDSNLKIYGGESLELSLKTWMCGGHVEVAVCSRVGHVFRRKHSFDFPNGIRDTIQHNTRCIAESWLEDYKFFFYSTQPKAQPIEMDTNTCSKSIQKANRLKQKLQCRSFRWYLQNVFQELRIPNDQQVAFGELKHGKNCLEVTALKGITVDECSSDATRWFFNQSGTLSIQTGNCLTFHAGELKLLRCEPSADQLWLRKRGNLIHLSTGKCLENNYHSTVVLSPCRRGAQSQIWNFSVEIEELTN